MFSIQINANSSEIFNTTSVWYLPRKAWEFDGVTATKVPHQPYYHAINDFQLSSSVPNDALNFVTNRNILPPKLSKYLLYPYTPCNPKKIT